MGLFKEWKNERLAGEGSTTYLYSKVAAKKIFDFNPDAKIIIIIREPVDFLYSLHAHFYFTANEQIKDFKEAILKESNRIEGKELPATVLFPSFLYYSKVANFPEQIQRYIDIFPRNQIKLIIFDDFVKDTKKSFKEVLDFLGVESSFKPDFETFNPRKKPKSQSYSKLLRMLDYRFKKFAKNNAYLYRMHLYLREKNARYEKNKKISPDFRKELMKQYKPEVKRLGEIMQRDLIKLWGYDYI